MFVQNLTGERVAVDVEAADTLDMDDLSQKSVSRRPRKGPGYGEAAGSGGEELRRGHGWRGRRQNRGAASAWRDWGTGWPSGQAEQSGAGCASGAASERRERGGSWFSGPAEHGGDGAAREAAI